ncbi:MAG: hypothetical protein U0R17_00575 [Acidimicrobiia bacterium]
MKQLSYDQICSKGLELADSVYKWHFHVMSPDCVLNEFDSFAFVLEDETNHQSYVYCSNKAEKQLAQELSPLLHGKDVMDESSTNDEYSPSEIVLQMRQSALDLNSKQSPWHHHMLYPACVFNVHAPNYVLMLESVDTKPLINVTSYDPNDDLKQIENLFFK